VPIAGAVGRPGRGSLEARVVRIAVVVHGYPPSETAGVELVAREQAEGLAARGHEVSVFARTFDPGVPEGTARDEIVGGIRVRRVASDLGARVSFRELEDTGLFDAPFRDFLRERRPDVVHVQHTVLLSPNLLRVAREAGCGVVLSLHDAFHLCHRLFLLDRDGRRCSGPERGESCVACLADVATPDDARARFGFMSRALDVPDAIVAPSHALAQRHVEAMPFLAGRITTVDPGIRSLAGRIHPPPAEVNERAGRLRFLFSGTWMPHKGLDLLVDALALLDPARWSLTVHGAGVAGHEAYVAALRERTHTLPVTWAGAYTADVLPRVLGSADVLVLPSRCDESYSRVVREARTAGLAVVAPATGGPAEALRHDVDALLVEPDSRPSLQSALARLLDEPGLVARLRAAPARFPSLEEGVARLESVLAGAVERAHARSASAPPPAHEGGAILSPRTGPPPPRVTVVIPSYNHAAFVVDAVTSALEQTERDVEVLVVDDGSTDDSVARLAGIADPRLEVRVQRNVGLSTTLNRGLARATGRWVKFLPSDDVLRTDCLARQLAAADAHPAARIVFALPEVVDATLVPIVDPAPQAWFDTSLRTRDEILRGLVERNFLCAPGALFDRELALAVGGFDGTLKIAQDYDLWLKMLALGEAAFVAERLVRVRWHGANQSAVVTPESEAERARVVAGALERMGLERWVELFRAAPGVASTSDARAALAAALGRSGLRELEPFVARLRAPSPDVAPPGRRRPLARLRSFVARLVSPAASPAPGAITPGPRAEHWIVLAPQGTGDARSGAMAAALACDGATVTLAGGASVTTGQDVPGVARVAPQLATLRALLRDRDERLRVLVQAADAASIAFAREARLRGARVVYDKVDGPVGVSRAALDSERALIDAADDLVGATRPTVKQLATARRLVHLLPDASDASGWEERARALRGIVARPTVAVVVACLPWHDVATVAACVDGVVAGRGDLAYRVVAVDCGAAEDVLAELERREEEGMLVLLRDALRGRASGWNLALRATGAEVFVLLDASRRVGGPGWLDGAITVLLGARASGAVVAADADCDPGDGWAWVLPRPLLTRVDGFDEGYGPTALEDLDLEQQLLALGQTVAAWPEPAPRRARGTGVGPADDVAMRAAARRFRRRWRRSPAATTASHRPTQD